MEEKTNWKVNAHDQLDCHQLDCPAKARKTARSCQIDFARSKIDLAEENLTQMHMHITKIHKKKPAVHTPPRK